jgi:queuine/archaeosine tRNA-ribosyltransferase
MKKLKEYLIENGFDAINENEYENDKTNVEFLNSCYVVTNKNNVHYGQFADLDRLKEVLKRYEM